MTAARSEYTERFQEARKQCLAGFEEIVARCTQEQDLASAEWVRNERKCWERQLSARKTPQTCYEHPVVSVPQDAISFRGHRYAFFQQLMFFDDARKHCKSLGGELLILNDRAEADFIKKHFHPHKLSWVGISNVNAKKRWLSVDGSEAAFVPWGEGEPNKEGKEPYVLMNIETATLHDVFDGQYSFVCEWTE